jgi:hypothetical protein
LYRLLRPERKHRVDARRAKRRYRGGGACNQRRDYADSAERDGVGRPDTKQQRLDRTTQGPGADSADREAKADRSHKPTVLHVGSNSVMPDTTVCLAFVLAIGLAGAAMGQEPDVPPDALIRLQRTSCFGPCPTYTVTIDARGTVTFDGERFVRVVGRKTAQMSTSTVGTLLAHAERIRFFEMRDAYRVIENPDGTVGMVTDLPTKIVTVTVNGRTKRVEDYVAAPDSLAEFEREIDAAAGTKRWVFVDEDALEELTRSGWLASSEEGASLLQRAIERDDVPIARRLIELGSDFDGPPNSRLPPLLSARSGSMVDLLVKAGANPNERPIGRVAARTPLMETSYKDAAVAEALLKAGARLEDLDDGRTALWYAACAGNWRVAAVLLRAGANPLGSTATPAAECTRRARQFEMSLRRTVLDRGRPTVDDFDQVIALLESATKRMQR